MRETTGPRLGEATGLLARGEVEAGAKKNAFPGSKEFCRHNSGEQGSVKAYQGRHSQGEESWSYSGSYQVTEI